VIIRPEKPRFDHILLIGYGGPTSEEEVLPFIEQVTKGRDVPPERLEEVREHYRVIGGRSPYNEYSFKMLLKVETALAVSDLKIPVLIGMRNWHPFLAETLVGIKRRQFKNGLAVILAPHRAPSTHQRYKEALRAAQEEIDACDIHYEFIEGWHDHPYFIQAHVQEILRIDELLQSEVRERLYPIFTAHSIPKETSSPLGHVRYEEEFHRSAQLIALELGWQHWTCAYQSRSGRAEQPWLGPDILEILQNCYKSGKRSVIVIPVGFFCENVEVLYDLDVEAKELANELGMDFFRSSCVADNPLFIQMLKVLIFQKMKQPTPSA